MASGGGPRRSEPNRRDGHRPAISSRDATGPESAASIPTDGTHRPPVRRPSPVEIDERMARRMMCAHEQGGGPGVVKRREASRAAPVHLRQRASVMWMCDTLPLYGLYGSMCTSVRLSRGRTSSPRRPCKPPTFSRWLTTGSLHSEQRSPAAKNSPSIYDMRSISPPEPLRRRVTRVSPTRSNNGLGSH
jgi:hypothetical protein